MEIDINIRDYLSEEEITEIVRDTLRTEIRRKISASEIERICSNTCYQFVFDEIDKIAPNYKEILAAKVKAQNDKDDFSFHVFHRKSTYSSYSDSAAISIIDSTAVEMKDELKERVVNTIRNYNLEQFVSDAYGRTLYDLEQKYAQISEMFWLLRKENSHIDVEKES